MPLHHNVAGTWKNITAHINVAGTWKVATVWHNVAGVWKQIAAALGASLPSAIYGTTFTSTGPVLSINSDGTWSCTGGGGSGTWKQGGVGSDYQVMADTFSGNATSGTFNSWLGCGSNNQWQLTAGGVGTIRSCTFRVQIRMAASPNTVFTSSNITLECDRT